LPATYSKVAQIYNKPPSDRFLYPMGLLCHIV
jgi:hypothetical protein